MESLIRFVLNCVAYCIENLPSIGYKGNSFLLSVEEVSDYFNTIPRFSYI